MYVSGFVTPVKAENKEAYVASARAAWTLFQEYGALSQVEAWGTDIPDGQVTDFKRSVQAEDGEVVVFSWLTWPDKAAADDGFNRMMEDPRMKDLAMPFDGKRMIWGGFEAIFQAGTAA